MLFLLFWCYSNSSFSQEHKYKEYSYSELFEMIEKEKDSIFKLKDAIIILNEETDKEHITIFDINDFTYSYYRNDTIVINKEIRFDNVQFGSYNKRRETTFLNDALHHIIFRKKVGILNMANFPVRHCVFKEPVTIYGDKKLKNIANHLLEKDKPKKNQAPFKTQIRIENSVFEKNLDFQIVDTENTLNVSLLLFDSKMNTKAGELESNIVGYNLDAFFTKNNVFNSFIRILVFKTKQLEISNNIFFKNSNLIIQNSQKLELQQNQFNNTVAFEIDQIPIDTKIEWKQFSDKLINWEGYRLDYIYRRDILKTQRQIDNWLQPDLIEKYKEENIFKRKESYLDEVRLRSKFLKFFQDIYDLEAENSVYTDLKDLETKRFEFVYNDNPSFKSFFTWKINQFLKIFSGYGTEPARAVVFSLYVILFFTFIYLLFPNSWDSLGKKRLMHRFEFFQKYLRRKDGMHSIYLEDKQDEISSYEDFKTNLEKAHLELPSFFITWSKPLYNASMFSSRLKARFLKTTDVLKGKWKDLSPKQKRWKNIQIGFLLTLGLVYDLFIKALNALMLSINTFTTLGFGEIPIKGLPRYLAIIQGFIGWFMLTIFSVSLISQLLN